MGLQVVSSFVDPYQSPCSKLGLRDLRRAGDCQACEVYGDQFQSQAEGLKSSGRRQRPAKMDEATKQPVDMLVKAAPFFERMLPL